MSAALLAFRLLIAHALCDFSLQSDFMALIKNRHTAPANFQQLWPYGLAAHGLVQAGGAWVASGNGVVALLMLGSHIVIDALTCERVFGFHVDQALHGLVIAGLTAYVTVG